MLRSVLTYAWAGPPRLPASLQTEWRLVIMRWLGIALVLPSLHLLNLPAERLNIGYVILAVAGFYNLVVQSLLRRQSPLLLRGYTTTLGDALLNVAMVLIGGGFNTPMYFLLYTVIIASAMRYGYVATALVLIAFVGADGLERFVNGQSVDGALLVRSGFLTLTGVMASYLRGQLRRAENALQAQLSQARHEALHDRLTGLPNRNLLTQHVDSGLRQAADDGSGFAILYIGLHHMKAVNNTFGHRYGDILVTETARRLAGALPPTGTLARASGDQFAVLLPDVGTEAAVNVGRQLLASLREPVILGTITADVTASVGIAVAPLHGRDAEVLQRRADLALYAATLQGEDVAIWTPQQDEQSRERLQLVADLRQALERGELFLEYQPIVALESGRITEVEALVRWNHPLHGRLGPAAFVPLAEETGAIVDIGRWVLRQACTQVAEWRGQIRSAQSLAVSVNVSARQFQQSDVAADVATALASAGLPAEALKLEITESIAVANPELTIAKLWHLKGSGVRLAIDDFGTGYSSLGSLKRFPVDTLKIDKVFVDGLSVHPEDSAIVEATIAFARALGLSTTAEGVETSEQLAHLRELGADRIQGYYCSRPLSTEALAELLESEDVFAELAPRGAGFHLEPTRYVDRTHAASRPGIAA
jgi:diguanylate cyclase (GGDEF)-like protein